MDYEKDYYVGLAGKYHWMILKRIVKEAELDKVDGQLLDYGCGFQHLKELLPKSVKYLGYDKIPQLSTLNSLDGVNPKVITCIHVLEHLKYNEIWALLDDFKKRFPQARLVTFMPTENWVSKLGMLLTGQLKAHDDHVTRWYQAEEIISNNYTKVNSVKTFFGMGVLSIWIPK